MNVEQRANAAHAKRADDGTVPRHKRVRRVS